MSLLWRVETDWANKTNLLGGSQGRPKASYRAAPRLGFEATAFVLVRR